MIQTLHIVPEYNEDLIYPAICKSMEALNIAADLRPEMNQAEHGHGKVPRFSGYHASVGGKGRDTVA